jgi:enoyl-CoA hydratase
MEDALSSETVTEQQQEFPDLRIAIEGGLAVLTIDRPKALNALNASLLGQLDAALDQIEAQQEVRVLILTGGGEKAFVAGADIGELKGLSKQQGRRAGRRGQRLFSRFEDSRLLVIAAVNGFALGGGLELAMACDIRVLSEKAVVGLPEVTLGIIPGYGGTQRLTRLVGTGHALELITTGRKIDSAYALSIGLANRVVAPEALMDACKGLAGEILANAPLAVCAAKRAVRQALEARHQEGYYAEAEEFATLCTSQDANEGMTAFFERRKARFQGQ